MKYLSIAILFLVALAGCGCRSNPPEGSQDRQPVLVAEVDGVKVWAVKHYPYNNGDFNRIYFTTPSGHVVKQPR